MESLPKCLILEFRPDTLQHLRKQYDLDKPERINEAINILAAWAQKQEHFEKKTFRRDYLERIIINKKGSIENAKKKLDKICTLRTLLPEYFQAHEVTRDLFSNCFIEGMLPKMTPDYSRVFIMNVIGKKFETNVINEYLKYFVIISEYMETQDYANNLTYIADWTVGSILEHSKAIDIVELRKAADVAIRGCSLRVKAIHLVCSSKAVDMFVIILKKVLPHKLSSRIYIHKNYESLYEFVPQDILPEEYGGKEKPLTQICENLCVELNSKDYIEYRKDLVKARTNEKLRSGVQFNDDHIGISGTFRALNVD